MAKSHPGPTTGCGAVVLQLSRVRKAATSYWPPYPSARQDMLLHMMSLLNKASDTGSKSNYKPNLMSQGCCCIEPQAAFLSLALLLAGGSQVRQA